MNKQNNSELRLRSLLGNHKGVWTLSFVLGWVTLIAVVALLAISGWFISASAMAGLLAVGGAYQFDIFRPAALIRLSAIVRTAGRYGERLSSHHAVLSVLLDLRCRLFARLASGRLPAHQATATQQHRLIADIDLLDRFPLSVIAPWLWASLMLALLGLFYYLLHPVLFYASLAGLIPAWLLIPVLAGQRLLRWAHADVAQAEQRKASLLETVRLRAQLVIWRQWLVRSTAFAEQDWAYLQQQYRQQSHASKLLLWQQWALALGLLLIIWQGLLLVQQELLTLPWLVAVVLAYLAFYEILAPLASSLMGLGLAQAARDRLNALAHTVEPESGELTLADSSQIRLQVEKLQLARGLSRPMSWMLEGGQVLLIGGPSGAGKSSLLDTLAGDLQPVQGRCLLNGQPYTAAAIRPYLGYLEQGFDLFNMSLADNLRLGKAQASDAELWRVLELVELADWAKAQPLRLDTPLGEYALEVSGGQARRIALARLLLQPRPLLLLDEPLAGLDALTAENVMAAVLEQQRNGILLVVSHVVPQVLAQADGLLRLELGAS